MSEEKYIDLPERARLQDDQLMLFPEYPKKFIDDFQELYKEGLLSFDPTGDINQTHTLQAEIGFFSSLLSHNLTIENIKELCEGLDFPYQYDPHKLMYSFKKKQWYACEKRDTLSKEYTESLIEEMLQNKNAMALRDIIHLATDALFQISNSEDASSTSVKPSSEP